MARRLANWGWLLGLLFVDCSRASKPSSAGCCDRVDNVRDGAETGSEVRVVPSGGAVASPAVWPRFRKEEGCARDFKSSGTATGDLATLQRLCAQGMAPVLAEPVSLRASAAGAVEVPFQVATASCFRTAVVASAEGLSISLVDPRGVPLVSAASSEAIGVVPVDGTVCVRDPGAYRTVVHASTSSPAPLNVTVQIWQASRD